MFGKKLSMVDLVNYLKDVGRKNGTADKDGYLIFKPGTALYDEGLKPSENVDKQINYQPNKNLPARKRFINTFDNEKAAADYRHEIENFSLVDEMILEAQFPIDLDNEGSDE